MSEKASAGIVRFEDFEFDLSTRELRKFGTRLRLEDKPAQLLCILLERAPDLITRNELHGNLWSDGIYVDRNHGVNKCVNQLRLVLGDDPVEPRYIETLRGRGYRFIAQTHSLEDTAETVAVSGLLSAVSDSDGSVDRRKKEAAKGVPWRALMIIAAIAAILPVAFAVRIARDRRPAVSTQQHSPITSIVIGTEGAIDPPDNGFQKHYYGNFTFKPLLNRTGGGADRIEVTSDHMGYFYRPLTAVEKDFVLQRNWQLTCVCAVRKGAAHANFDLGAIPGIPRFDIELLQEGNKYYVALTKEISPAFEAENKFEFAGAGDAEHPHTYQLRYTRATHTASLWIDGEQKVPEYHGVLQFREGRGVMFGTLPYRDSDLGSGVFRAVRFEAY